MRTLLLLFFVCNAPLAFTQTDSLAKSPRKYEFGFRPGFYSNEYSPCISAYLTARKGIHELAFGPSFGTGPGFYEPFYDPGYDNGFLFDGMDLAYRILTNGKGKVFDFYFQVSYLQKWRKATGQDIIFNYPELYDQTSVQVRGRFNASSLLIEYGFDIKFLRHFYVGASIGTGGTIEFRDFDYVNHSELNFKEKSINLGFILRTSVGFRF